MSCQALIPPAAITMITIARVAGLIEKPIVRGTAAISPFGPSTAVSFVLIPIHIGAGVARVLSGNRHVCKGDIRHVELGGRHGRVWLPFAIGNCSAGRGYAKTKDGT